MQNSGIKRWIKLNFSLFISISIHAIVILLVMGIPVSQAVKKYGSPVSVEWVKNLPDPVLKHSKPPKELLQLKTDQSKKDKDGSRKKTVLTSASKIAWVLQKSDRKVERSVEINNFPRREIIPDIMTYAKLKQDNSDLANLVSTRVGPVDGNGLVGNQVRAKGDGGLGTKSGAQILGLGGRGNGTSGDGLTGSGGGSGTGKGNGDRNIDRLGIINFLDEGQGAQKVIYCLDVSASMSVGNKLKVSIDSIKESMLQLSDSDKFNIVTFFSNVKSFKEDAVPATLANLEKANKFLNSFTVSSIENNMGTDILGALKFALSLNPDVIVLVTDIQPTRGEVDENKIAEEVKKINKNTKIYGVGIEVWEPSSTGRLAKLLKMLTEQNNGQMKLAKSG